jgi:hypothetical protein
MLLLLGHVYNYLRIILFYILEWGTRWRSWLRNCATSLKVAGSIPDGTIEIFHRHNPSAGLWPWGRLSL